MYCNFSTDAHGSHDLMDINQQGEFNPTEKKADKSVLHPGINENSTNIACLILLKVTLNEVWGRGIDILELSCHFVFQSVDLILSGPELANYKSYHLET